MVNMVFIFISVHVFTDYMYLNDKVGTAFITVGF